jgi:2-oxoisovalerate dehydrogenase E1 component
MPVIVEIMFPDFSLVAADQLFNQIAKARHMYGGSTDLPLVARTRIATGCGYGGQHSMDPAGSSPCSPAGAWWLPATPSTTSACSTRPCAAWTRW